MPLAGQNAHDAIAFNNAHADEEMPFFAQEIFELTAAMAPGADDPQPDFGSMTYNQALEIDRLSGVNGIDKALADFDLDAVTCADRQPGMGRPIYFMATTSSSAARDWPRPRDIPSCRCRRTWCLAFRSVSASSAPRSASRR